MEATHSTQSGQQPAHVLVVSNETVGGQSCSRRSSARGTGPDPLHRHMSAEAAAEGLRDL